MLAKTLTLASNAGPGNGAEQYWPGGDGTFQADATFGGGSVKLQTKGLNGTWVDVANASLAAAGTIAFSLAAGPIRAVITTSTLVFAYATPKSQQ